MTWSWLPPVLSPVPARALIEGIGAAMGLIPDRFEDVAESLRARYGAYEVLLTDSGTSALVLALKEILPRGGTVAYPSYACIDLTAAAIGAGVNVRLYDVNPATVSPDLASLRSAIKRGVDAIVVAHLYGYPADIPAVRTVAAEEGIPVIEDAAQGAGGRLFGAPLGGLGDVSVLSFGRGKGTTGGSGGALLARTQHSAEWIRRVRSALGPGTGGGAVVFSLGAQRLLSHPSLYRIPASIPALRLGEMVYHPPRSPRAMSSVNAAVLRWTLGLEDREVSDRRGRARDLMRRLRKAAEVVPVRAIAGGEPGFLRLPVLDQAGTKIPRPDLGILRGYPMTLGEHAQLRPLLLPGERAGNGSQFLRDRLFTIPTHSRVGEADLARLGEWFAEENVESQAIAVVS